MATVAEMQAAERQRIKQAAAKSAAAGEAARTQFAQSLQLPTLADFWNLDEASANWVNPYFNPDDPRVTNPDEYTRFDYTQEGSGIADSGNLAASFDKAFLAGLGLADPIDLSGLGPTAELLKQQGQGGFGGAIAGQLFANGVDPNIEKALELNKTYDRASQAFNDFMNDSYYQDAFRQLDIDPTKIRTREDLAAIDPSQKAGVYDIVQRTKQAQNQLPPRGIMDSVPGNLLKLVPTIAGVWTGNPWVGGLLGAGIGGASGGLKGAAFGGLSGAAAGYFSPGYGQFAPPVIGDAAAANALGLGGPEQLFNTENFAGLGGSGGPVGFLGNTGSTASWAAPTSLAGGGFTSANGLGITADQLFRQPLNNITTYDGGGFFNPDAVGLSAEDLYNPVSLGGSVPSGNNELLKKLGVSAAKGLLEPQQTSASTAGTMSAMGGGGGGGQRAPYNPMLPPPPPGLPEYFDFGTNPFGGYA